MRSCGDCQACCVAFDIPGKSGAWERCPSQCASGCGVYDDRPAVCREFRCVWLREREGHTVMTPEARPDRLGVIFRRDRHGRAMAQAADPGGTDRAEPFVRELAQLMGEAIYVVPWGTGSNA